jgi:hypothetical protein
LGNQFVAACQTITLEINAKDLASFVPTKNAWIAEAGNYKVAIDLLPQY